MNSSASFGPRRVIGLMLVKNEDRFVGQALRNVLGFCDRVIVLDNASRDRTPEIVADLAAKVRGKIEIHRIENVGESHAYVLPFLGSRSWMLAVDGDEIYDPQGLVRLRRRLLDGEFDSFWRLYGHVLNAAKWSATSNIAKGYASPPGHPMTKLYNLEAIRSWTGADQRLHGGRMELKDSWDEKKGVYAFFHHVEWDQSDFRCLHMVFVKRSSLQRGATKWSPADVQHRQSMGTTRWTRFKLRAYNAWIAMRRRTGKDIAYRKGPLVERSTDPFFPEADGLPPGKESGNPRGERPWK